MSHQHKTRQADHNQEEFRYPESERESHGSNVNGQDGLPSAEPQPDESSAGEQAAVVLEKALEDAENRFLRAVADFDNYRKRMSQTMAEAGREEQRKLIGDLLEVRDNLRRALEQAKSPDDPLVQGIVTICQLFDSVLEKHGVIRVEALAGRFDPERHEAIDMAEAEGKEPLTITRVYQDGFLFHGRLLRPARVQVARPPEIDEHA